MVFVFPNQGNDTYGEVYEYENSKITTMFRFGQRK